MQTNTGKIEFAEIKREGLLMYHFKNKEDYLTQRQAIIDEAQNLINEGKIDEANKKTEEVNGLDEAFEAYAKAQANISSLNNPAPTNIILE